MMELEDYFMEQAELASKGATCNRLNVGCVLVKDEEIIGTGWNDSILSHDSCDKVGHLMYEGGCKRTVHAEMKAILDCLENSVKTTKDATAYVTHYPCPDCMKVMNQAGIKKVYYKHYYEHRYENEFHNGMEVIQYNGAD